MERNQHENNSETTKLHSITYRKDIDGLRAFSIILVVIDHYWSQLLPMSNIGVVIFFVISGYLISSIIFKEHLNNCFSLSKFYTRRVRRILPSLQFLLIYVLFFTWIKYWNTSEENKKSIHQNSLTVIFTGLMSGNIYFGLLEYNVFFNNCLAQLWSLGIQQQFYLIWPLLAGFVIRKKDMLSGIVWMLGFIFISLMIRVYFQLIMFSHPLLSEAIPLCRFWQLFYGCLLAYIETKSQVYQRQKKEKNINFAEDQGTINNLSLWQQTKSVQSIFSIIAFLSIIVAINLDMNEIFTTRYFYLVAVIGTFVMIGLPNRGFFTRYILQNSVVQYLGKISYDLYLWHFTFHRTLVNDKDPLSKICYLLLSIIVAAITTEITERKIRRNPHPWTVPIILFVLFFILLVSLFSYLWTN